MQQSKLTVQVYLCRAFSCRSHQNFHLKKLFQQGPRGVRQDVLRNERMNKQRKRGSINMINCPVMSEYDVMNLIPKWMFVCASCIEARSMIYDMNLNIICRIAFPGQRRAVYRHFTNPSILPLMIEVVSETIHTCTLHILFLATLFLVIPWHLQHSSQVLLEVCSKNPSQHDLKKRIRTFQ